MSDVSNLLTSKAIETQLNLILVSEHFSNAQRLKDFLAFVVRESVKSNNADHEDQLKEYSIGLAVFGKKPDFDPRTDSTVRAAASRLRAELRRYYETDGRDDAILIDLPKGRYVPRFMLRAAASKGVALRTDQDSTHVHPQDLVVTEVGRKQGPSHRWWHWIAILFSVLGVAVGLSLLLHRRYRPISSSKELQQRRFLSRSTSESRAPRRIDMDRINGQLLMAPAGDIVYAISGERRSVTAVGVGNLKVQRIFDLPLTPRRAFLSSNGKHLYVSAHTPEEGVMVLDTSSGRILEVIRPAAPVFEIAVTPNERKLFLAMGFGGLERINLETRETRLVSPLACPLYLDSDPAGRRLYVAYQHGGPGGSPGHDVVDIYDVNSEQSVSTIRNLPMVGQHPTVSPQGDLVLLDGSDACASPAYDHIGCLAVPSHILHLWDTTNGRLIASIPPQIPVTASAFFSQGSRILFVGSELTVWDWARQLISEKMKFPGMKFQSAAFTPTGDRVFVSVSDAPGLFVFDAENQECLPSAKGLTNFYSGDGTLDDSQGLGSLTSATTPKFAPGRIGQAFRFDGKEVGLATISGSAFCTFCDNDWTVSLFVKFDSLPDEMTILDWWQGKVMKGLRIYKARDNHVIFQARHRPGSDFSVQSVYPTQSGQWYHVAVVTENNLASLYMDGVLQGQSFNERFTAGEGRSSILLGASQGRGNVLSGLIDELAVYNRALLPSEVKMIADHATQCATGFNHSEK